MAVRQFCTFVLGDYLFGVDVHDVREVLRGQEMTRVPLAPPAVRGLMNLRGRIVPAIDLRRQLGLGPLPADRTPMNVVVQTAAGLMSLLVDGVGDVLAVGDEAFERPPETLHGVGHEAVRGAYKLDGRLLLALDVDTVVQSPKSKVQGPKSEGPDFTRSN